MDKGVLRREFLKMKTKGSSYATCKRVLRAQFDFQVSARTLKRWVRRFDTEEWNLQDCSRRPHTIHRKITSTVEEAVLRLRKQTGWGSEKLQKELHNLSISERSIDKILNVHALSRVSKSKGRRARYIRWQREHKNSLWQIDHTDEQEKGHYTLSIVDDATRYSLALVKMHTVTTNNVIIILDALIKKYGKPKEILTDNGSAYGGKSKHSKFDRWCNRKGIKHIRTKIHSPTTNGKVERLFKTMDQEMSYCNQDLEVFRMRYNHFRPHSSLNGQTPAERYNDFSRLF